LLHHSVYTGVELDAEGALPIASEVLV